MFFPTPAAWRAWLEANHDQAPELLVGFYKVGSGKPSITWPESVDQALCFGWIDGIRKSIDDESYSIRFTPRRPKSTWSAVNIKRMQELIDLNLVHPTGLKAFESRTDDNSAIYAYEQRHNAKLDEASEQKFRANPKAWAFLQSQASSYQKAVLWWVVSAKKEETRQKRLATLIEESENERMIAAFTRPNTRKK